MDGDLLTKMFFGGISGILFYWIGQKLFITKSKHENNHHKNNHRQNSQFPDDEFKVEIKKVSDQKKILEQLRNENLLTNEEYKEKIALFDDLHDDLMKKQKQQYISNFVEKQIKTVTTNLDTLYESGVLSKDEYESKKKKVFDEKYQNIMSAPYLSPDLQIEIETKKYESLTGPQQRDIDLTLRKMILGDVILLNKRTNILYLVPNRTWVELCEKKKLEDCFYIQVPGLFDHLKVFS